MVSQACYRGENKTGREVIAICDHICREEQSNTIRRADPQCPRKMSPSSGLSRGGKSEAKAYARDTERGVTI